MIKLTDRVKNLNPSSTLQVLESALSLKRQGKNLIDFGAGEPEFDTPENIKQAAIKALKEGFTKYTPASGIIELKEAICYKLKRENNITYSPDEIIVSCGAKQSLFNLALSCFDHGDEVIIPSPYWVSYPELVKIAGAKPVIVDTSIYEDFQLTPQLLKRKITDKTKALILNYPNNPTGTILHAQNLKEILNMAAEREIMVISDECYEKMDFEGMFRSPASFNELKDSVITVNSLSKTYSMTGWRIGYAAGNKKIIDAMAKIQGQSTSNPNSIAQKAAVEALTGDQSYVNRMREEYKRRRDYVISVLNSINGIRCAKPRGTFYAFPDVSEFFGKRFKGEKVRNSSELADFILNKIHIAVVPGAAFGSDHNIRLSFSCAFKDIKIGLERIKNFFETLE